jgi:hypothetical protein
MVMTGTFAAPPRAVNRSLMSAANDSPTVAPHITASPARADRPFDDAFDDISGGFDDVRYAAVEVNPLI